jgi:hypothetical protein
MRMAEKLFFIPEREFVMFSAKPVTSGSATTRCKCHQFLSGTWKIFLPFSLLSGSAVSHYSQPNLATKGQSHSLTTIGSFIIILYHHPQKHTEGCRAQVEKLVINVQY